MGFNLKRFLQGIRIVPVDTDTTSEQGDLQSITGDTKLHYNNGTTSSPIVTETHADQGANRLQNKDLDDATTAIVDSGDTSKKLNFSTAGATTGTETTINASQTVNRTLTLPDVTDTLTANAATQTLTNKTISTASNTIVLVDTSTTIQDSGDATKQLKFSTAGATTGTNTTIDASQTANRVITLPDATDTLAGISATQNITNKTFTSDTMDVSANTVTNIADANIAAAAAIARTKLASGDAYRILANDSSGIMSENAALTANEVVIVDANGQLTDEAHLAKSRGGSGQDNSSITFPASGVLVTEAGTETLTNKTLTSPTINTPVIDVETMVQQSTPSNPPSGDTKFYIKTDGNAYLLQSNGTETPIGSPSFTLPTVQIFTATGPGTYTTPANVKYIRLRMVGGGGRGGGGSSSNSTLGTSGGNGADTTFGTFTAGGGIGGAGSDGGAGGGGAGGAGGTATLAGGFFGIAVKGGYGSGAPGTGSNAAYASGGTGGSSAFGGNGGGGESSAASGGGSGLPGTDNTGGGGGGGGAGGTTVGGGAGGGGAGGYIDVIIPNPGANYSYGVGAGSTSGGTPGPGGGAGGSGGSGVIYVEEFYI